MTRTTRCERARGRESGEEGEGGEGERDVFGNVCLQILENSRKITLEYTGVQEKPTAPEKESPLAAFLVTFVIKF